MAVTTSQKEVGEGISIKHFKSCWTISHLVGVVVNLLLIASVDGGHHHMGSEICEWRSGFPSQKEVPQCSRTLGGISILTSCDFWNGVYVIIPPFFKLPLFPLASSPEAHLFHLLVLTYFQWILCFLSGNIEIGNGYGVPGGGAYYGASRSNIAMPSKPEEYHIGSFLFWYFLRWDNMFYISILQKNRELEVMKAIKVLRLIENLRRNLSLKSCPSISSRSWGQGAFLRMTQQKGILTSTHLRPWLEVAYSNQLSYL